MTKLTDLQNEFIDGVYDEGRLDVLRLIKDGKVPKEELLDIYRNNLYATLTNSLRITYPKVYQFIGEREFKESCREFVRQNRSCGGNLDDYGEGFVDFLAKKEDQFLSDLAKLEWLKHKSYSVRDTPLIGIENLQELSQEKLFDVKFKLHPSCFLLDSSYNLLGKKRQTQPQKRQNYFLVYRQNFEVRAERIPKGEYNFLRGVEENLGLYQIYEKYEINIHTCLQKYLANGALSEFLV